METITLGDETELPRIGFGTLYITTQRGFGAARSNAHALLKEAVSLGIRFFDTADSYGPRSSEEAVRAALHPYDGLMVATKGGFRHETLGAWQRDARPEHLRAAIEGSLGRLGLDLIELYQLHCPGFPDTLRRFGGRVARPPDPGQDPPHRSLQRRFTSAGSRPA